MALPLRWRWSRKFDNILWKRGLYRMTDGREDSEDILRFLASNVESIHDKVGGIENRLGGIETRIGRVEDHMATKEELAAVRERMATKEDVTAIRGDIERVRFTDRQYRPHPFHAHGSSGQRGQPVTECCVSTCQGSSRDPPDPRRGMRKNF